ncbi:MAG: ATP-binding cassette domain-containing protein [Sphingomonadales bacterium]|nr:ATP-binding cassette domain-containing protein [Sphingomonadales bacterium]
MSIEVNGLAKQYGTQRAVDTISFSICRGEIVGFLGPNGAGKSTTLKMLTGYLTPDNGSAQIGGIDVVKDPIAARKKIGYLTELNALYYDMFVREYLLFIAELQQVPAAKVAVEKVIVQTRLSTESHKRIAELSKGYKQRVGIAAALVHDPEVLILDEPTSGLDPNQLVEIRELIQSTGINKTVLFSTHILQEAEAICNRVIIIHKGKIVADSLLSELHKKVSLPRETMSLEEIFRYLTSS